MITTIEDFFKKYAEAAWKKDPGSMIDLYSTEAIIFDMWEKGVERDHESWAGSINDWLGSLGDERVKVDFDKVAISSSENVAFASALVSYQALDSDNKVIRGMTNRMTVCFKKIGGNWKVTHQHTSAPIGSHDLKAILNI